MGLCSSVSRASRAGAIAALALFCALAAGCAQVADWLTPKAPREWAALVDEIRAFESRIGFTATDNFLEFSEQRGAYPFCGTASRLSLPYSYEDPAIQWRGLSNEQECRALAEGADIYVGTSEAVGEISMPVTPELASSKLDRFLYLVIHEDCHDQFDLPYGIEEALCNLIAYKAMAAFSMEKFGPSARADWAVRRYAAMESQRTRATIVHYEQLAGLYVRYSRNELTEEALLRERARVFSRAERDLGWKRGPLTNVGLASDMTYSRHYPFLEGVFETLGRDLERTVAFFKRVDHLKPSRAAIMKERGLTTEKSVDFLRAYEAAVLETAKKALAAQQP